MGEPMNTTSLIGKRLFSTTLGATTALCALLAPGEVALAQKATAEPGGLTEVVVTARKRVETLINAPLSVQALSADEMQASGITDLRSLQTVAGFTFPQVVGTAASGRNFGSLIFRGLAVDGALPQDASGSLFIDGIYISGGLSSVNMSDVDRVEVLKGPQNAYFGRSTFGGLVNLITGNPSTTFKGKANAEFTDRGTNNFDLMLEGPLFGDTVRGRLLVLSNHKAGQYTASDGGKLGDENTKSITGTLYATPSENLWVRLRGHYQEDDDSSAAFGFITGRNCSGFTYPAQSESGANVGLRFTQASGHCGPIPTMDSGDPRVLIDSNTALPASAIGPQVRNSLGDPFLSLGPTLNHMGLRRDTYRLAVQGGYSFANNWTLDFNAGYNNADSVAAWDLDRSANLNFQNVQPYLSSDMTVDMRLSTDPAKKIRGLLGASYFRSAVRVSQIDLNAIFGATTYALNLGNYVNNLSHVPAAYASVDWDIIDTLTLSGDVRYQEDEITTVIRTGGPDIKAKTKQTLPRLTLSWKPDRDSNFYVTYAEGVQPLSLNAGFAQATPAQKAFLQAQYPGISEYSILPKLKSFEIGAKQKLFDGRLQYTVALYDSKWKNRTTQSSVFNPPSCNGPPLEQLTARCPFGLAGSFQTLANDATVKGVELNVDGMLTDRWTAGLALTYNDAKWDKYYNTTFASWTGPVPPATDPPRLFNGNTLAKSPDLIYSLSSTYRAPLVGNWEWFVRGDLRYQGKMWDSDVNITQSDTFTRLFVRTGVQKDNVSIEFYANNLTNDKSWDYIYRLPDLSLRPLISFSFQGIGAALPSKREFGIRASYSFD
jgi:iron complex outermembrane receptor protein